MASKKRLREKATSVAKRVLQEMLEEGMLTTTQLKKFQHAAKHSQYRFPRAEMVSVKDLWIDYEVQRDVILQHILNIISHFDPRLCGPASACQLIGEQEVTVYDAQHRVISCIILGFDMVPGSIVDTDDEQFPSYAFEQQNHSGTVGLTPGDLHRNALTRYKKGSREKKNCNAYALQEQFNTLGIDLESKSVRASAAKKGDGKYFFSHFNYAYKGIALDEDSDEPGVAVHDILKAIITVYPDDEEVDQGLFIGLWELKRLMGSKAGFRKRDGWPDDWMIQILTKVHEVFPRSHVVHSKAKAQWLHISATGWTAPRAMSNFLREIYEMQGGELNLPTHTVGGKKLTVGVFPNRNHVKNLFRIKDEDNVAIDEQESEENADLD
jgi:hypothetical protein